MQNRFSFVLIVGATLVSTSTHVQDLHASESPWALVEDDFRLEFTEDSPVGVATHTIVDSSGIYILDAGFVTVHKFSLVGEYLGNIGREGEGPGEFYDPATITSFGEDLYIGALSGGPISRLGKDGTPRTGIQPLFFNRVQDLCFDRSGALYTVSFHRPSQRMIHKYEPTASGTYEHVLSFCGSFILDLDVGKGRAYEPYALGWIAPGPEGSLHYLQVFPPELRAYNLQGELLHKVSLRPDRVSGPPRLDETGSSMTYVIPEYGGSIGVLNRGLVLTTVHLDHNAGEDPVTLFDVHDTKGHRLGGWEEVGRLTISAVDPWDRLYIGRELKAGYEMFRCRLTRQP